MAYGWAETYAFFFLISSLYISLYILRSQIVLVIVSRKSSHRLEHSHLVYGEVTQASVN